MIDGGFQITSYGGRLRYTVSYVAGFDRSPTTYPDVELLVSIQGGPKKTAPNFSCNNFGKYGPILIMFSLLHSQMN